MQRGVARGLQWEQVLDGAQRVQLEVREQLGQRAMRFGFTQQVVMGALGRLKGLAGLAGLQGNRLGSEWQHAASLV